MRLAFALIPACVLLPLAGMAADTAPQPLGPATAASLPAVPRSVDPRRGGADLSPGITPVVVQPGATEIIPIAAGHINRIITPFETPVVTTGSSEQIETRGGVLYVAPSGERPITLYVTERGDESQAISLTLVPREIPPHEVKLAMPAHARRPPAAPPAAAAKWEQGQPFVQTLTEIMRRLALGQTPQGYDLAPIGAQAAAAPRCAAPSAWRVDFAGGQYLAGGGLEVFVGRVTNTGPGDAEFTEAWCGDDRGVAAVALWPSVMLAPAETAELYVVRQRRGGEEPAQPRPSLIGG